MKKFVLLFRMDLLTKEAQPSSDQMKEYMASWMEWVNWIDDQNQLAEGGNHFMPAGKVIRANNDVANEPYVANKESVAGYILILARNMDDAMRIAGKCPILNGEGTSVEVRETATPG